MLLEQAKAMVDHGLFKAGYKVCHSEMPRSDLFGA
jgi:hypothetical protein